jgi:pantoate--beta-alanine ligase
LLQEMRRGEQLVLVPTMGALHEGHLSLVEAGRRLGPVVVSIFVNPTQFGPDEDFEAYPRTLEKDLELLRPLDVDAVFAPDRALMYPASGGVTVQPGLRANGLCGGDRPGHFTGVLTVVAKLFGLVRPDIAIFGRKDAQQCLVIDQMVQDLELGVRLVDAPTVRETDGLALSSRNRYLDADQRKRAVCLVKALRAGRLLLERGERNPAEIRAGLVRELEAADSIEYAEVRRVPDLTNPDSIAGRTLLAVSAQVGPARLIDNFVLDVSQSAVADAFLLGPVIPDGGLDESD